MKLTTPPLAPSTLQALEKLGIATLADLRAQGAAKSFLLLKAAGLTPVIAIKHNDGDNSVTGVLTLKVGGTSTMGKLGVGYHYDLSKRTKIYADFARDGKLKTEKTGYDFGIQHNF